MNTLEKNRLATLFESTESYFSNGLRDIGKGHIDLDLNRVRGKISADRQCVEEFVSEITLILHNEPEQLRALFSARECQRVISDYHFKETLGLSCIVYDPKVVLGCTTLECLDRTISANLKRFTKPYICVDTEVEPTRLLVLFLRALEPVVTSLLPALGGAWYWKSAIALVEEISDSSAEDGIYFSALEEEYARYADTTDTDIFRQAATWCCLHASPELNPIKGVLLELVSDIAVQEGQPRDISKRLEALDEGLQSLTRKLFYENKDDIAQHLEDVCNCRPLWEALDCYPPKMLRRVCSISTKTLYEDEPKSLCAILELDWAKPQLDADSVASILSSYSTAQFPWLENYPGKFAKSPPAPKGKLAQNKPPEESLLNFFKILEREEADQYEPDSKTLVALERRLRNLQELGPGRFEERLLEEREPITRSVEGYGQLIALVSAGSPRAQHTFSIGLLPEHFQTLVDAYYGDAFEKKVSLSGEASLYRQYLLFGLGCLSDEKKRALLGKCLGKWRMHIRGSQEIVRFDSDYNAILAELGSLQETKRLFGALYFLFKEVPSSGDGDTVRLNWHWNGHETRYSKDDTPMEVVFSWFVARWLPEQVVNIRCRDTYFDYVDPKLEDLNYRAQRVNQRLQLLVDVASDFCIDQLKLKKGEKLGGSKGGYLPEMCKEPNTHWRRALLEALVELRVDRGGNAHKVAYFVSRYDFDPETRKLAKRARRQIKNQAKSKSSLDLYRGYLAALWQLRMGKARALGVEIDERLAKRWRTRDLQRLQ